MKSMSLAAIFWCILITSSETSKENATTHNVPAAVLPSHSSDYKREYDPMKYLDEGCHCDCLPYQNISKIHFWKEQIKNDCNCLYVAHPIPVPSHDVEEYCRLCDCKSLESSDTAIKVILIVFLLVFVNILLFNIILMVVKHFSHKPDAYTNPLHNEEESEDPHV